MSNLYTTKQPGDILRLPFDLEHPDAPIEAGGYVLLSVGDLCCVARLNEAPGGKFVPTNLMIYVAMADLYYFQATGMSVQPLER